MANALFYLSSTTVTLTVFVRTMLFMGRLLKSNRLEFYGRLTAFFLALFICASYGTVASVVLSMLGYGGLAQWTVSKAFKWTMLPFTGLWMDIDDPNDYLNKTRPAVFIGNHQTELDILLLGHIWPKYCSVTAKKSLQYVPFLGWFMYFSKAVFIERSSRSQAFGAFDKAVEQMHSKQQSVYLFPEGTRSYYDKPDLLPFKKGAFHLAIQAQVPIVPIVCANYSNILSFKKRIFHTGTIPVKILAPIETKGKTKDDLDQLLNQARSSMLEALKAMSVDVEAKGEAPEDHKAISNSTGTAKTTAIDQGVNAAATRS